LAERAWLEADHAFDDVDLVFDVERARAPAGERGSAGVASRILTARKSSRRIVSDYIGSVPKNL
jgi:hypothetical protein